MSKKIPRSNEDDYSADIIARRQSFIEETLPKIRDIRGWIDATAREIDLVVDGGIDLETVERAAIHGARVFVAGTAFFKSLDYKRFVNELRARLAPYE